MSHVYTVTFHPPAGGSWLASARHHDRRVALAEMAVDSVSGEEAAVIALPAGFLRASNAEARDRLAEAMLQLSRRAQVAVVFGIDVAPDGEWAPLSGADASYAYACDSGKRALWPAQQVRASTKHPPRRPAEPRCVELAGQDVGVVISSEAFNAPLRLAIARAEPALILMLAHSPPTDRWSGAVASWNAVAPPSWSRPPPPTLVARPSPGCSPLRWSGRKIVSPRPST